MSDTFIQDDTEISLADQAGFQTVDRVNEQAVDRFVGELGSDVELEKRPLSRSPYFKIGVGLSLAFFVIGMGFLLSLPSGNQKGKNEATEIEAKELTLSLEAAESEQKAELDDLRAEIAMLEQQTALADLDDIEAEKRRLETVPASSVSVRQTPPPPPAPSSTRSNHARSQPSPQRTSQPASSEPEFSRQEEIDPQQQWYAASTSGMIGVPPPVFTPDIQAPPSPTSSPSSERSGASLTPQLIGDSVAFVAVDPPNSIETTETIPGLINPQDNRSVLMGQRVKGRVSTAIAWLDSEAQYLIELEEAIIYRSGDVAIPAGGHIIVQPITVNQSNGYAELAVVGVRLEEQSSPSPLPHEMFTVNGENGDPLIADRYNSGGGGNFFDELIVGVIGGIGEELSEDSGTIEVFSSGTTITSSDGNGSIVGGALAGGADAIQERVSQNNEDRNRDARNRQPIFFLEEGAEVEIYINQEFRL